MFLRVSTGFFAAFAGLVLCRPVLAAPQDSTVQGQNLTSLSLEDLTHIDVSSVSRKPQELFKTAAAVFVITAEDIRASGANSLPELFRMVPGMQVAQINANSWAVSARGFNSRFADKMLVLIDGRSIYSEIYSGVFWDMNDIVLSDIERIEVIRGPGGSLWGANAVNGVINIITRSAKQTLGTKVDAVGGRMENGGSIRYGAKLGDKLYYRGFAKYLKRNALTTDQGTSSNDAGDSLMVGGRGDLQASAKDLLSFHGEFFRGTEQQRVVDITGGFSPDTVNIIGGYGLARWEHRYAKSDLALQAYYSDEYRQELGGYGREHFLDFDFQHHLPSFHRNDVVYGLGYRVATDHIFRNPSAFASDHHLDAIGSFFLEDEFSAVRNKLVLTGGFKLQHNSYTGAEIQPTVRVLWTPDSHHSVWSSFSRAVRTPSVQDLNLRLIEPAPPQNGLPTEVLALGNPAFKSEAVVAYQAGYRQALGTKAWVDLALFQNHYIDLRSQQMLLPYVDVSSTPTLIIPIVYENNFVARSRGAELAANLNPIRSLHLQLSYSWMNGRIQMKDGTPAILGDSWSSPTHTISFRPTWAFARRWTLNSALYSVSRLERASSTGQPVAGAYVRLDGHLSFNLLESLKLTTGVNNLQQSRHPEFDVRDGYTVYSEVPRSAFIKAVWSF